LPEWFGIPEAVETYVREVEQHPMLAAHDDSGLVTGFVAVKQQSPLTFEAFVLGVRPKSHRQGIGRALFAAAEEFSRQAGGRYLTVKTISAISPDPHYAVTRTFYEAIGFEALEEFPLLWGKSNPCLMMIKVLDRA
jgi:ribosomal protein S18 acetylase RimI-like enzyme